MKQIKLAIIPGDGIGKEVTASALKILQYLQDNFDLPVTWDVFDWGAEKYLTEGVGLPEGAIDLLSNMYDGIIFGALGDPRIPDMRHGREILLGLRRGLNLYVNYRPVHLNLLSSKQTYLETGRGGNVEIYRENTQGLYQGIGGNVVDFDCVEVAIDQSVYTRSKVESFLRHVFSKSAAKGTRKLTLVHKSNAVPNTGKMWCDIFFKLGQSYPMLELSEEYVDAFCYHFVRDPERFDVVVSSNLFGDIISDIGAALMGGLGLAASANICPETGFALFEPVHGSAPDIAGLGIANPVGAIMSMLLMLEHYDFTKEACIIRDALATKLSKRGGTPDLGGRESTAQFTDDLLESLDLTPA